ncbi:flagellar hook-associated family protein [Rhizobium sp. RAF56]|jgi:flagellar hook-associated protein 3 FlgL|uniref:flagellar hook-associated family protein n=1 Tax=Rhizobium sp. RAF56 TaxID=3233062 RepID=UPI003F951F82
MKLSFISSNAIQNAMRQTIRQSQNEMTAASQEATTGIYADIGLALGGNTAKSVDLSREVSRIDAITNSNSIVTQRLSSSQQALTAMSKSAQTMLDQLVALSGNQDANSIQLTQQTAASSLETLGSYANTMVDGEYLFAGINTDVKPFNDDSTNTTSAINTALTAYMTANSIPSVDKMTGAQMTDFITTKVEPMFTGAGWSSWSSASSQNMTSRISNSEVVESSTNTNTPGMRYFALASVMTSALMGQNLSADARSAVSTQAISYTRQAIDGINDQQATLGLSESRVSKANDALSAQKDIIQNRVLDLQGVDPYEASTKVNSLQTQLETAYTIVAKIQQLSLVNYL